MNYDVHYLISIHFNLYEDAKYTTSEVFALFDLNDKH